MYQKCARRIPALLSMTQLIQINYNVNFLSQINAFTFLIINVILLTNNAKIIIVLEIAISFIINNNNNNNNNNLFNSFNKLIWELLKLPPLKEWD